MLEWGRGERFPRAFRHRLVGAEADRAGARRALWRGARQRPLRPRLRRARRRHLLHLLRSPPAAYAALLCAHPRPHRRGSLSRARPPLRRRPAGDRRATEGRPRLARARPRHPPHARRGARRDGFADQAALHELHEAQIWRASYWRAAREDLTYRRFFEIADLVGVRVERPRVFDDVHSLLLRARRATVSSTASASTISTALPTRRAYLQRLQEAIGGDVPFYLLVEKILGAGETLRPSWPVAGTTGYEFIEALAGLFVDSHGEAALTDAYEDFLGGAVDYRRNGAGDEAAHAGAQSRRRAGLPEGPRQGASQIRDPATRDHGADSLRRAILEFAAALPVYRTYVNVEGPDEIDLSLIAAAAAEVKATREVEDEGAVDFIARLLRLDFSDPEMQGAALEFTARFQQTTGPVMAKALEDTVFYRYNRLIALNEVGGEPQPLRRAGRGVSRRHAVAPCRAEARPYRHRHPRHEARRGCPRAALCDQRDAGRMGRSRCVGGAIISATAARSTARRSPSRSSSGCSTRRWPGAWPAELRRRRRRGRRGAGGARRGLHAEGGARSEAAHELGLAERRLRDRRSPPSSARAGRSRLP